MSIRPIKRQSVAQPTLEGAGVHLSRAFGFGDPTELDPFFCSTIFAMTSPRNI